MHQITVSGDSPHFAAVAALLAGSAVAASAPVKEGAAQGKTAGKDKTAEKPKEKTTEERSGGIAYETVSAAVLKVSKEKGRDAAMELLGEFKQANGEKATKGKEIEPEDYASFMEKADELLAEDMG